MHVFEIHEQFGIENLKKVEREQPDPGPYEVKLRMLAASINYRDWLMVQGQYNPRQPLPLIPCSDGVGEVVAVGEHVSRVAVGDRVCPTFFRHWTAGEPTVPRLKTALGGPLDGTLAEYMTVHEDGLVPAPEHLSDEEAATLACAGVTAWSALVTQGGVQPGDSVLIQGTGGVSMFALQFAVMLGAYPIVTSSSDEKLEIVKEMGARETINYRREPRWGKAVRAMTERRGVDHVVEVGGAGTLQQSLEAVRPGGCISVIGVLAGGSQELNIIPILMRNIRLQGVIVGPRESFEAMNRAIARHQMRPHVHRVFDFDQTPDAFAYLAKGEHMGKIAIRIASR